MGRSNFSYSGAALREILLPDIWAPQMLYITVQPLIRLALKHFCELVWSWATLYSLSDRGSSSAWRHAKRPEFALE